MSATKLAQTIGSLRARKRAMVPASATACTLFLLVHPDEWGRFVDLSFFALFVMLIASQLFWFGRILGLVERVPSGNPRRGWFVPIGCVFYLFVFIQCGIVAGGVLAWAAFLVMHPAELLSNLNQSFFVLSVMRLASQFFLIRRVVEGGERILPERPRGVGIGIVAFLFCTSVMIPVYTWAGSAANPHSPRTAHTATPLEITRLLRAVYSKWGLFIAGSFWWWLVASWVSFILVMVFWTLARTARGA